MFKEWAGVTPKKFLQYLSIEYAKSILKDKETTLFDAAYETGLSGTSRLHDPNADDAVNSYYHRELRQLPTGHSHPLALW